MPCRERDDRGRAKALRLAEEWAGGLDLRESPEGGRHGVYGYCVARYDEMAALGAAGGGIERSTRLGYKTYLNYIGDYFDGMAIEEVRAEDVTGFVAWLHGLGLADNSVKKAYNVLRHCMRHAVKTRVLEWNPCDATRPPRQVKKAPNPLTEGSRRRMCEGLSALDLTCEVTATWVAYMTGMRRGEVCALRWRDVHLSDGFAVVSGAIAVGLGGAYEKETTKGGRSREVPIPPALASVLSRRRSRMLDECAAGGHAFTGDLFVCGRAGGSYLNPQALSRWWAAHAREWSLVGTQGSRPVFHDLRHTYATLAVRALDVKDAQDILGHASIQTTMDYADTEHERIVAAGWVMEGVL